MHGRYDSGTERLLRSRTGLVLLTSLAIAAFFLATEHTAHLYGALPYLLVLLFAGLHLFGRGRRDEDAGRGGGRS